MSIIVGVGAGKSELACAMAMYNAYVEMKVYKLSKYKRLPRKLKKSLSDTMKNRIKECRGNK